MERDVALAPLTTLGVGGPARRFARVRTEAELVAALGTDERIFVLGGGSNVVVGDAGWDGLCVQIALGGIDLDGERVRAGAGVVWDDFVAQMVRGGRCGVECLSGIPGLVGATPIQNVGAYGQEVADTIESVRAYDRDAGAFVEIAAADCGFGYRTSKFKHSARWIVTAVTFVLPRGEAAPVRYAEAAKVLGDRASLAQIRETIIGLRRAKGMVVDAADPDSRSAGSFFTNPIVDAAALAAFRAKVDAEFPHWAQPDGTTKLSAGWLIERAGFAKGTVRGAAGLSTKHALAIINRGGATAADLLAFAREIQAGVQARFGVALVPEPVIV